MKVTAILAMNLFKPASGMSHNYSKIILFLLFFASLEACMILSPSSEKSATKLYESFYVGDDGTQYFIKPLVLKGNNGVLALDLTFRYKDEVKDSATAKFTLKSESLIKRISLINWKTDQLNYQTKKVDLLFNEKKKKYFKNRFEMKIPVSTLDSIFNNTKWDISLNTDNGDFSFFTEKRIQKRIKNLQDYLFVIFE